MRNSFKYSSKYSLKPVLLLTFSSLSALLVLSANTMLQERAIRDKEPHNKISSEQRASLKKAAAMFLTTLRGVLVQSMAQGIPAAASVCADTAQTLTQSIGKAQSVELRRISLKARNAANIPTASETKHLQTLETMQKNGTLTDSTVIWDVVEKQGVQYAQLIRPIVLNNALCLNCHGQKGDIAPETASILQKHYPNDHATGYTMGEVRGAVSVLRPISP